MKHPETLRIDTLSGGWCDKDIVLLHACFQLLSDCVEKENLLQEMKRGSENEDLYNAMTEVESLYKWWKKRQKMAERKVNELDPAQYAEDNSMLIRLVTIRQYLWT